ncbi:MAG: hypothetical protein LUD18_11425 [Lachnospiraceae bacterium]|nr:hypothetical protein [Lachnospiraceae bacterium]
MTTKNFISKGVLPVMAFVLVGWLGSCFYMVDGQIIWLRFAMLFGVFAGIPHMFLVIPGNLDMGGTAGMVAACVLIGGLIGIPVAVWKFVCGIVYLIGFPACRLWNWAKRRIF